jgi:hypothetical protein
LDALYAKANVIHAALDAGQDVVVRMKEERRSIMKDAKGLFDARPADAQWDEKDNKGNVVHVKAWDEVERTSWPQVRVSMRMVKVVRTTERRVRAWLGILILAVNFLYTFVYAHLHHFRDWAIPLSEVIQEMKEEVRWTLVANTVQGIWETG